MRKKIIAFGAVVAALVAVALVALSQSASADQPVPTCAAPSLSYTVHDVHRPDSGQAGNIWANDVFTRKITGTCTNGVWLLEYSDNGKFYTIPGQISPGSHAVALPAKQIVGKMSGGANATVTTNAAPHAPVKPADGWPETTKWMGLIFDEYQGDLTQWSWTYQSPCCSEKWVNAFSGNYGDITRSCYVKPHHPKPHHPTSSTPPPTTTTTTTVPPTSSTSSGTSAPTSATTSTDAVAPVGHVDTGTKDDVGDLAYTGTSDKLPVLVWLGIGLVLIGGLTVFLYRQRSRRSGSHRS